MGGGARQTPGIDPSTGQLVLRSTKAMPKNHKALLGAVEAALFMKDVQKRNHAGGMSGRTLLLTPGRLLLMGNGPVPFTAQSVRRLVNTKHIETVYYQQMAFADEVGLVVAGNTPLRLEFRKAAPTAQEFVNRLVASEDRLSHGHKKPEVIVLPRPGRSFKEDNMSTVLPLRELQKLPSYVKPRKDLQKSMLATPAVLAKEYREFPHNPPPRAPQRQPAASGCDSPDHKEGVPVVEHSPAATDLPPTPNPWGGVREVASQQTTPVAVTPAAVRKLPVDPPSPSPEIASPECPASTGRFSSTRRGRLHSAPKDGSLSPPPLQLQPPPGPASPDPAVAAAVAAEVHNELMAQLHPPALARDARKETLARQQSVSEHLQREQARVARGAASASPQPFPHDYASQGRHHPRAICFTECEELLAEVEAEQGRGISMHGTDLEQQRDRSERRQQEAEKVREDMEMDEAVSPFDPPCPAPPQRSLQNLLDPNSAAWDPHGHTPAAAAPHHTPLPFSPPPVPPAHLHVETIARETPSRSAAPQQAVPQSHGAALPLPHGEGGALSAGAGTEMSLLQKNAALLQDLLREKDTRSQSQTAQQEKIDFLTAKLQQQQRILAMFEETNALRQQIEAHGHTPCTPVNIPAIDHNEPPACSDQPPSLPPPSLSAPTTTDPSTAAPGVETRSPSVSAGQPPAPAAPEAPPQSLMSHAVQSPPGPVPLMSPPDADAEAGGDIQSSPGPPRHETGHGSHVSLPAPEPPAQVPTKASTMHSYPLQPEPVPLEDPLAPHSVPSVRSGAYAPEAQLHVSQGSAATPIPPAVQAVPRRIISTPVPASPPQIPGVPVVQSWHESAPQAQRVPLPLPQPPVCEDISPPRCPAEISPPPTPPQVPRPAAPYASYTAGARGVPAGQASTPVRGGSARVAIRTPGPASDPAGRKFSNQLLSII